MRPGFFGAAGEVTGSCTLVEADGLRFVVDCDMFQGGTEARGKNQRALHFGCDMRRIVFVLPTHVHIGHSGLPSRLAMLDYRGPVYATPATIDPLHILLPDSAHIQEKEAEWHIRATGTGTAWGCAPSRSALLGGAGIGGLASAVAGALRRNPASGQSRIISDTLVGVATNIPIGHRHSATVLCEG